jgi:hypothetical protein
LRALKRIAPSKYQQVHVGIAPHDTFAPIYFQQFLGSVGPSDPVWSQVPTWIIDTGDQTTFGDAASWKAASNELRQFKASARASEAVWIRGNHDAWGGAIPPLGRPTRKPAPSKLASATVGPVTVEAYSIDTIDSGRIGSIFALGHVEPSDLNGLCGLPNANAGVPVLRFLLCHHPIHYPPPVPRFSMHLANATMVGQRLSSAPFHIVLSGHTHCTYPQPGKMPPSPGAHSPLGSAQLQLVTGTLMQLDRTLKMANPHQCQLLRLWLDSGTQGQGIVLTRHLVTRPQGAGGAGMGGYQMATKSEDVRFTI